MRVVRAPTDHLMLMPLSPISLCRTLLRRRRVQLVVRSMLIPAGLLLGSACAGGESKTGPDNTGPGPAAKVLPRWSSVTMW